MTLADSLQPGGCGPAQCEPVRSLLPYIQHFVRIRAVPVNANLQAATLGDVLDGAGMGVVQLDRHGRIREANDCARDILQGDKGVRTKGVFCVPTRAKTTPA